MIRHEHSRDSHPNSSSAQLALFFGSPASVRRIWPVHELVGRVRELMEQEFGEVWVEGEISNLRPAASGHLYFTLKDEEAQLPVVLFRKFASLLRFQPKDGLHVLARGGISIYDQRGQLQLVAETMEPVGAGSLQLAFEQLRDKLRAEGLFDPSRKRPLPAFPRAVGIVTSPTGAVIRDFLNVAGRRHTGLNILLAPATVQGESAPEEIESAIASLNASGLVDVIVVARGGGSLEDLAAFNSERVARAIAASRLPVVSAVGHETDFTIADFVADLRAPTPSAAAELITEAQHNIAEHLALLHRRLERAMQFQLLQARQHMAHVRIESVEARMTMLLQRLSQRLDDAGMSMEETIDVQLREHRHRADKLTAFVLQHDPRRRIVLARQTILASRQRLVHVLERNLHAKRARLDALKTHLHALSPLSVLERGYALVLDTEGKLIRSAKQIKRGETLRTRLSDGSFTSRVEEAELIQPENPQRKKRKQ